jgi:hypothetical protein
MDDSAPIECVGCREWIAGDERVAEFVVRREDVPGDNLTVDRLPMYAHAEHEDLAEAFGYSPTDRAGILDELRDTWTPNSA